MQPTHRPGLAARRPFAVDAAIALVLFAIGVFVIEGPNETLRLRSLGDVPAEGLVLSAVAAGSLLWRRRFPLPVLAVTLLAASATGPLAQSDLIGLPMLVALYSVGRAVGDVRWSAGALAVTVIVSQIMLVIDGAPLSELVFGLVVLSAVWYIGRRMRSRAARAVELERERQAEARGMVIEERTRIARELHDVVAHRVSLMTVQAGAAKTVADDDPQGARRAMEAVEKEGRQVLGELRHLLGVLRPADGSDGLGPQPGLADLPRLVEQFREAGLEVSLAIDDERRELPVPVALSAYRIVQEALTNVLKHAGPDAHAEVGITGDDRAVTIEVLDDGRGATILPGSGHGIFGMRERALLLGGTLDAGPRLEGGFRVTARLPTREDPM
jgi:signal transduction histidine kinase